MCCCHWDAQQGSPLPWLAASQQLEVLAVVDPHDAATVCLELCGGAVQITYHAAERIVDVCGSEAVRNQEHLQIVVILIFKSLFFCQDKLSTRA